MPSEVWKDYDMDRLEAAEQSEFHYRLRHGEAYVGEKEDRAMGLREEGEE